MKKHTFRNGIFLLAFCASIAFSYFYFNTKNSSLAISNTTRVSLSSQRMNQPTNSESKLESWENSPFSKKGIGSPEEIIKPNAARQKKMETLGYGTPPEYYNMPHTKLKLLAKKGDLFAMLQLGEQYYFESDLQKQNLEFDSKVDYKLIAKQYFSDALMAGHARSAAILSNIYMNENNPVDAYAWNLLSERFENITSEKWHQNKDIYSNLTDQQKKLANIKFNELFQESTRRFIEMPTY